jgi:hypothetical protein
LSPSDWSDLMAVTVTFVKGVSPAEAVRRLRRDPASAENLLHEEVWELQGAGAELQLGIQVDELNDLTVIIEPNGWLLTTPEYAEAVSQGAEAVSVYWNVNAVMQFVLARDGRIVRRFDPLLYDQPGDGEPLPEEPQLPFGDPEHCRVAAIELAERIAGVHLTRDWLLAQRHPTYGGFPPP